MSLQSIYAQLTCSDLAKSAVWFATLFGRDADASPMPTLNEWHHGDAAGFQLVESPDIAARGNMTLIVTDLQVERRRLTDRGWQVAEITKGDFASFVQIKDPDGNTVTLAQPAT